MSAELLQVLSALAKLRGTSVEHEVARHNVGVVEARREHNHPMAATEEERLARVKASRARSTEKAKLKRKARRTNRKTAFTIHSLR